MTRFKCSLLLVRGKLLPGTCRILGQLPKLLGDRGNRLRFCMMVLETLLWGHWRWHSEHVFDGADA